MEQYEIVIVNDTGDDGTSNLAGQGKDKNEDNIATPGQQVAKVLKYAALQSVRTLIVSKVGEVTRDNMLQRRIDLGISVAEDAIAFAIHPVFGAINLGVKIASQAIDYQNNLTKQTRRNTINLERAGYLNRSRD